MPAWRVLTGIFWLICHNFSRTHCVLSNLRPETRAPIFHLISGDFKLCLKPPPSLWGGYRSSASTPPAAARECGSRGWTKGQVLHWQYLPSGFVIVALMWDFFTELPGVQHWFGFYEDPQPLSLLSKTIPSSCAWPRMKAARRSTLSYWEDGSFAGI